MAYLTQGMWVVVADGERAVVLENTGDTQRPVLRQVHHLAAPDMATASDRPGRMADKGPNQRSALETPDIDRLEAEAMVRTLMGWLEGQSSLPPLVLVAPPQVLGAMRAAMGAGVRAQLRFEMDKTLTRHPLPRIAELVAEELGRG